MTASHSPRRAASAKAAASLAFALAMAALVTSVPAVAHGALDHQIEQASAAIMRDPANAELYVRRGELHRAHGAWDAALDDYRRAAVLAPGDERIDFLRGRALQQAGRPESAKVALDRHLAHHPGHVEARIARGRALRALGQPAAAATDFTVAIDRSARPDPDIYLERARAQVDAEEVEQASAGIDAAIARMGAIPSLQLFAVELDVGQGRYEAALTRLDAAAARAPRREAWLARRADVLARAGRPDDANLAYAAALAAIETLPPGTRRVPATAELEARLRRALAAH
jgi:tetratricopeptide (TPR) repeat protein